MSNAVSSAAMYEDLTKVTKTDKPKMKKGQLRAHLREARPVGTLNDGQLLGHIVWRHRVWLVAFIMGSIMTNVAWIVLANR